MLTSLALIFLCGMLLGGIFQKLKLPGLLGMLLTGIVLGPYALNLLDESILSVSADLRQLALVIILIRAGLSLDIRELKAVGRPAILLCFVPACFEILGMVLIAPALLKISLLDAAIMGAVVGAVSPAVIVPRMLRMMEKQQGTAKGIPQMILAGASVDDVFVIVLFTSFTGLAQGGDISPLTFLQIPVSIVLGLIAGGVVGLLLGKVFQRLHRRDSIKVLVLLSAAFLWTTVESLLKGTVPFSGLLAVMSMAAAFQKTRQDAAVRLSAKFSKLWIAAELVLFVLVGAEVNLPYAAKAGGVMILVILGALLFRVVGVMLCMFRTSLSLKERLFCAAAYLPKATVQAAIGGVPLAMGLGCGEIVLTAAVLAILITAPLGAFLIDRLSDRLIQ